MTEVNIIDTIKFKWIKKMLRIIQFNYLSSYLQKDLFRKWGKFIILQLFAC